jgi:hypothetical protein
MAVLAKVSGASGEEANAMKDRKKGAKIVVALIKHK